MPLAVNHIGIPVSDVEASTRFYLAIGGRVVVDVPPAEPSREMDELLALRDARLGIRHILIGSTIIELLWYLTPPGRPNDRCNADIGSSHVGFSVDDVFESFERLRGQGVQFNSAPMRIEEGPFAGGASVFCCDPDGNPVELLQLGPKFKAVIEGRAETFAAATDS